MEPWQGCTPLWVCLWVPASGERAYKESSQLGLGEGGREKRAQHHAPWAPQHGGAGREEHPAGEEGHGPGASRIQEEEGLSFLRLPLKYHKVDGFTGEKFLFLQFWRIDV